MEITAKCAIVMFHNCQLIINDEGRFCYDSHHPNNMAQLFVWHISEFDEENNCASPYWFSFFSVYLHFEKYDTHECNKWGFRLFF